MSTTHETHSQLKAAQTSLFEAARHANVDESVIHLLETPKETLTARLMVRMDDGAIRAFTAWRCRYDDALGPTKGGIRFHQDASLDEVETLAFRMMCKCAVMNLPFGGGKGGVKVDPRTLSLAERERLSRAYVRAFFRIMGPRRDIPAPDVNTNSTVMGWMVDEYSVMAGEPTPAFITGKPISVGGSLGRNDATARGGFYLLKHIEKQLGLTDGKKRVAVQGFGNAGQYIATLLHDDGYKIVAVSDSRSAVANEDGLNPHELVSVKEEKGTVGDYAGTHGCYSIDPDKLIATECEVLVPSALEDMIHGENADTIQAKVILELANGPVTPEGDAILHDKGVVIIPDILANAGGVTVSYYEWVQNLQGLKWSLEDVHKRLQDTMEQEGEAVWKIAFRHNINLRTAAYVHALERITAALDSANI